MSAYPKPARIIGMAEIGNNIKLWYETFGEKKDPSVLLIMGAGTQAILWSDKFCNDLAQEGYYVIRYDHRDVGYSSKIDYQKNPYTVLDLKQDAIKLLKYLNIQSSHVVGMSMGGYIAQYMAIQNPSSVKSLTLISTTADHSIAMNASINQESTPSHLPAPDKEFLMTLNEILAQKETSDEGELNQLMKLWRATNGNMRYDENYWRQLCKQMIERAQGSKNYFNHLFAQKAIMVDRTNDLRKVNIPSLVIQGRQDPIFPKQHGRHLADILTADYIEFGKMGHNVPQEYEGIIKDAIVNVTQAAV